MDENGMFQQAEMTSCGLNGGPLKGIGTYPARIACNLWSKDGTGRYDCKNPKKAFADHPYFTQDKKDGDESARQYIANMRDGAVAGFKYFDLKGPSEICFEICGRANGSIQVSYDKDFLDLAAVIPVSVNETKIKKIVGNLEKREGVLPLYIKYAGEGSIDFFSFSLEDKHESME